MLTKVIAKDEAVLQEKGKTKLELPNYESFSVEDLHAACLDRLATSREMEIGLVSMMKNKYEVCSPFHALIIYPFVAPKAHLCLSKISWVLQMLD